MNVELGKQPRKYMSRCTQSTYDRLNKALSDLQDLQGDIKKLHGRKDEYRIKVPPYRIIFKYDKTTKVIIVTRIDVRGDVYKMGVLI